MVKSSMIFMAFALAVGAPALGAGVDLSGDASTELRSRADGLLAEKNRNPAWDGGTTRLAPTRGDVDLSQSRGDLKTRPRGDVKAKPKGSRKAKTEPVSKKVKRVASEMPGALVR